MSETLAGFGITSLHILWAQQGLLWTWFALVVYLQWRGRG